jgi:hypothetical protein
MPLELTRRKFTPPQLARQSGLGIDKVLGWIRTGALRAVNLATKAGQRPRWYVDQDDWEQFLQSRSNQVGASPAPARRRPQNANSDYTRFEY